MENPKFDLNRKDTKFYAGDLRDWAIQGDKCFGVSTLNPTYLGFAPNKHPGEITSYEGTEVSREQFAKMYPALGL